MDENLSSPTIIGYFLLDFFIKPVQIKIEISKHETFVGIIYILLQSKTKKKYIYIS